MKLCVVTGEASGDLHASEVIQELRRLDQSLETFGIGGDLLRAEGMEILHHVGKLGIVGLFNVIRHLGMFRAVFHELIDEIRARRPDAVLLVDFPGFNLRVARDCKRLGIPVIYYISPQVWAWRKGRVAQIARDVDEMLVIFPFEEVFYRELGVRATYVGHPLAEQLANIRRGEQQPDSGRPLRIALLPGSRVMEITTLLPAMLDAIALLRREREVEAWIVLAPTIDKAELAPILAKGGEEVAVKIGRETVADADIALSSSGTATLECAMLGVPVVVMYRLTAATYLLARWLVRLPHFSLVNIVAGREVVPELIQGQVRGDRIAEQVRLIAEPENYQRMVEDLKEVRRRIGEPGASGRAAGRIHDIVQKRKRVGGSSSNPKA